MPKKDTNKVPTEYEEQCLLFKWIRENEESYPALKYANASLSGIRLSIHLATKAKRSGMVRGFPDIFLPLRNSQYNGLFIELKRLKGGVVSKEQKDFIAFLNKQKYLAVVCRGHKEAIEVIKTYLELTTKE